MAIGTISALMLPAIALNQTICGEEEHLHQDTCYLAATEQTFSCTNIPHQHTPPSCYDGEGGLICSQADFVVHSHDGFCFQEDGAIRCALPEVEEHIHTEECYQIPEIVTDEGHTHADTCYQWLPGEAPTCSSGHIHQDSCYTVIPPTFCGEAENPEHIHADACYVPEKILVCTMEEDPDHQHTQDCYSLTKGELLCTEAEREPILQAGEPELICGTEESEEHPHTEECYQIPEIVADEGHAHTDSCYQWLPSQAPDCGSGHIHVESCYTTVQPTFCGQAENPEHSHSDDCYAPQKTLVCAIAEEPDHQHTQDCYSLVKGELLCTEAEREPVLQAGDPVLTCEETEIILHSHTENCYQENEETQELILVCTQMVIEAHQHTQDCISITETKTLVCQLPEHTHQDTCRGNTLLTEEEQMDVDALIFLIDALPSATQIEETLAAHKASGDDAALAAYSEKTLSQLRSTFDAYDALTENQKAAVTNAAALMGYEYLLDILAESMEPQPDFTVSLDNATVEVEVEGEPLPPGTQFTAQPVAADSESYSQAWQEAQTYLQEQSSILKDMELFDLGFANAEGQVLPVEAATKVTVTFAQPLVMSGQDLRVLHFGPEGLEEVTADILRDEQGISSVTVHAQGFSFYALTSSGEEHIAEKLDADMAYISLSMKEDPETDSQQAISTGTASWDSDDNPGNDSGPNNSILRTFDVATYTLIYETHLRQAAQDNGINGYRTGTVYFEFILPVTSEKAQFEVGSMGWLSTYHDVKYSIDPVENNGVPSQVLRGSFLAEPVQDNPAAIGNSISELNVAIRALAMQNGATLAPQFTLWLDYNHEAQSSAVVAGIPTNLITGSTEPCPTHNEVEHKTITPASITISAAPRFNVALKNGNAGSTSYVETFDFSTGNDSALDKDNQTLKGKLTGYGLTLQMVGKDKTSGLKGVQVPTPGSTITFDVTLSAEYTKDADKSVVNLTDTAFRPRVWSAAPNMRDVKQPDGRIIVNSEVDYMRAGSPYNSKPAVENENVNHKFLDYCKDGGNWSFTQEAANPNVIHVTVKDFTIDLHFLQNFPAAAAAHNGEPNSCQYYNPEDTSLQNAWDIQYACFSAAEFWTFQPLQLNPSKNNTQIQSTYGDGSLEFKIKDSDLKLNGEPISQAITTDDQRADGIGLTQTGSKQVQIHYVKPNMGWGSPLTDGCFENGYDWATPGQEVGIYQLMVNDNALGDDRGAAYEMFIKWDDQFFEPTDYWTDCSTPISNGLWWSGEKPATEVLWVAKPDGSGWNHNGLTPDKSNANTSGNNYDWEMITASPEGMLYYADLETLKAEKKTPIGLLVQYRGICGPGQNHMEIRMGGKIKETCPTGYVYMATQYAAMWRVSDLAVAARDNYYEKNGGSTTENKDYWTSHREELIDTYARTIMPWRSKENNLLEYMLNLPTKEDDAGRTKAGWARGYKGTIGDYVKNLSLSNSFATLEKISYSDGNIGGVSNDYLLDSCLVPAHVTAIRKSTAQTTSQDGIEENKQTYSLDLRQRVVDYILTPSIIRTLGDGESSTTNTTTLTIVDTLPKELEYIPETAYQGGTYTQDPDCLTPGTVTGGTKVDPAVVKNADGTSTLTWTLEKVPLTQLGVSELEPIHFSARLVGGLEDQQGIENTVTIQSTSDNQRQLTTANNNKAIYGITIQMSHSVSLVKLPDQDIVEMNDPIGFTMYVGNNSAEPLYNQIIVEDLPYDGDESGTSVHGPVNMTEFRVDPEFTDDLSFFCTTKEEFRGKKPEFYLDTSRAGKGNRNSAGEIIADKASQLDYFTPENGWQKLTFDPDGTANNLPADTVQIVAVGTLPAGETLHMFTTVTLPESQPGDVVWNDLMLETLHSKAHTRVVGRSIEGLTWIDANHDGIQDSNEALQSGITVTLLKLDENNQYQKVSSIQSGQQINVLPSSPAENYDQGRYKFTGLLPGTYAVRFTSGEFDITYYHPSPDNAGDDDTRDSDGIPTLGNNQTLIATQISDIKMPTIEELHGQDTYHSPHHDSGFYAWSVELPATGGSGTSLYLFSGWAMIAIACALMYHTRRKQRKGAA